MSPIDKAATDIAADIVRIWGQWSDGTEVESELALRSACKEITALDLHQVEGVIASPLNYFARAYLDDENPEDLTICEMVESLQISVALMNGSVP